MNRMLLAAVVVVLLLAAPLSSAQEADAAPTIFRDSAPDPQTIDLVPVIDGLRRPLFVTAAPGQPENLYVLEQGGVISLYDLAGTRISTFLDLTSLVSPAANSDSYTERGLLGIAFHPLYDENGRLFVYYTDANGHTNIVEYGVSEDATVADPNPVQTVFTQRQPFPNHNGGHMAFDTEGYLNVALGDGGSANDPLQAGQDTNNLLGTIIRLDIDTDSGYAIPQENPFVNGGGLPEIWAWGLRNPWRFSFDRATGDLYIGDVGQNQWEELNFEPADSAGGLNYGWNAYEAETRFDVSFNPEDPVMPFAIYNHSNDTGGCSVTGGYVYRGQALPQLDGVYFYGDFCSGNIWAAYRSADGEWQSNLFRRSGLSISSFGEDAAGELYVVDYNGTIYRMVGAA